MIISLNLMCYGKTSTYMKYVRRKLVFRYDDYIYRLKVTTEVIVMNYQVYFINDHYFSFLHLFFL